MQKIKLITTSALFAMLMLSAQADDMKSASHNWNQQGDLYKATVSAANAERKLAKKLGFEWRDIGKFLKQAKKLHAKGDISGALKLVNKAKTQAVLGQQQAADQANAGPRF